jgi:integrase/ribosomal protein L37AE/L43A
VASNNQPPACPQCGGTRLYRDGLRYSPNGAATQRWQCRNCGHRFSQNKPSQKNLKQSINTPSTILSSSQRSCEAPSRAPSAAKAAKTLATVENPIKNGLAGATKQTADVKGKIVEYSFWLLKQGYSKCTIQGQTKLLKRLAKLGDLFNPESIKEVIAKQEWSTGRKVNAVDTYTNFLQMQNAEWQPPQYRRIRKLPFIPTENEVDQLIGGCNKRMATFLQLLKETGVRCGEACKLKWTDIDMENPSIRVTPEKGSNPRLLKISAKLISMLNTLPKNSQTVFPPNADIMRKSFQRQRRQIAFKLQNPRLMQISFHTFRHWKATMEYHKTKDILHVMRLLGHKNINNTLLYTQLIDFRDDDFTARVAHSEQEVCQLIEAGFEYVCDYNGNKIFRKRR